MKSKSIAGYLCCVVMRRFERRSDHAASREKDAKERASVRKFMICTVERCGEVSRASGSRESNL
jgi:hypothetical protein